MTRKPFFSIIIPTFNRKHFLKIAVESVIYQTFQDYELIIVDDGSSDTTVSLFKNISNKKIKYIIQEHKGVSCARNRGIKEAKGEFICFLDSDDRFRSLKLEITYQYINKYPQFKVFHTEELWYNKGQILPQKKYHKKPEGWVFKDALRICCISMSTVAIHYSVFEDIGGFDENMPVCEDYEFWLKVTAKYQVKLIPKILTIKEGGHPDQQSKKYPAMDIFRIYAISKLLENKVLNYQQYKLALEEFKKKTEIYMKGALKRGKYAEVNELKKLIKKWSNYVYK